MTDNRRATKTPPAPEPQSSTTPRRRDVTVKVDRPAIHMATSPSAWWNVSWT